MTIAVAEKITGFIERITYHNPDNGFCVLQIKIKNKRDLITVTGNTIMVTAGENIECSGIWFNHKEHGIQFKADNIKLIRPDNLAGIEKYLGSGLIKGIGPGFAKRLVQTFGLEVFNIIENSPKRLIEVPGLGESRQEKIIIAWEEQKKIKEIIIFLHEYGVGTARAVRIYKTYGDLSINKIKENPYRLAADIRGIGFKTADALAMQMGIDKNSLIRARAGIKHVLQEHSGNGHCAALISELTKQSAELLQITPSLITQAIELEIAEGELVLEQFDNNPAVFLTGFYKAETSVANKLKLLNSSLPLWSTIEPDKAISWVEEKVNIKLSASQLEAVKFALSNKVLVITGGPGVGKTTIVNSILKIIYAKFKKVMLCAPTGRAAKRLTESTGLEAKTIHRLLGTKPGQYGFNYNENNQLDCELLIVDEISMVDILIMNNLLKAIPNNAALILVGDVDQLPSVGPGAVLADIIDSNAIPTIKLTEIFRQAATSQIIINAHKINQGQFPKLKYDNQPTDFYFIEESDPEIIQQKLLTIVANKLPHSFNFNPLTDVQVLTPMNRGGLGANSLNVALKNALNPTKGAQISKFGATYSEGDKIIQTTNNYDKDVFNGDLGFINKIDLDEGNIIINFDGRMIEYDFNELDEISLAYAITIHKSQGSEYPAVVIPITTQHFTLLERNLLYTGVTRGKKLVILIGQIKALAIAVKNKRARERLTKLAERIRN